MSRTHAYPYLLIEVQTFIVSLIAQSIVTAVWNTHIPSNFLDHWELISEAFHRFRGSAVNTCRGESIGIINPTVVSWILLEVGCYNVCSSALLGCIRSSTLWLKAQSLLMVKGAQYRPQGYTEQIKVTYALTSFFSVWFTCTQPLFF